MDGHSLDFVKNFAFPGWKLVRALNSVDGQINLWRPCLNRAGEPLVRFQSEKSRIIQIVLEADIQPAEKPSFFLSDRGLGTVMDNAAI